MSDSEDVRVLDSLGDSRYEIHVNGKLGGFVTYERHGAVSVLVHTEVFDEFEGRGLAGRLVAYALDDIRANGAKVDAECPYVDSYIGKHPEYADLRA